MESRIGWKPAPSITVVKWWTTEVLWLVETDARYTEPHDDSMCINSENII
jgi:hypothetical protein